MQSFVVLTAQIALTDRAPNITRVAIDYSALRATGRPIGIAIRVEPYFGAFSSDGAEIKAITALASERLAEARKNGVEPVELQIDFDCAESKLDGYRQWLAALRETAKPVPVHPTTLPSWLKHSSFARLARESGSYVLQVHAVAPPRQIADTQRLTDPATAAAWVEQAARIGVPFRVALPTYTYLVAFDQNGQALGVSAEGRGARWPADVQVVRWEADPAELGGLVAQWTRSHPAALNGIIWYRLPVAGDVLNWRWPTLAAVAQGRAPASRLRFIASAEQPSEISVVNEGELDEPLPEVLTATWQGPRLVAADALADYTLERKPGNPVSSVVFHRQPSAAVSRLPPGGRRSIGWIRCETNPYIRLDPGDRPVALGTRHDETPDAAGRGDGH